MSFKGNEGEAISLELAQGWAAEWRATKGKDDPNALFFGRDKLEAILAQPGAMGIRIYFGVNDEAQKALILVGADTEENDQVDGLILDRGYKCPPYCPTGGGING